MCTKSKTTWGCGCSTKDRKPIPCDTAKDLRSYCPDVERFLFEREGDCRECRAGGDPFGRGMRGEGRYAQEMRREQRREESHKAGDDSYDRGRNTTPRQSAGSAGNQKPGQSSGKATDDDSPEEFEFELDWSSGPNRRSKLKDEECDDVIDLTPPESDRRERRHRARRSSPGPGISEYERDRDEFYANRGPRYERQHRRRRNTYDDEGIGYFSNFARRMRPRDDGGREYYGYRSSYKDADLGDFDLDCAYDFDERDFDRHFDYGRRPRRSTFSRSFGDRDGLFSSSFFSRRDDDFLGSSFRY